VINSVAIFGVSSSSIATKNIQGQETVMVYSNTPAVLKC